MSSQGITARPPNRRHIPNPSVSAGSLRQAAKKWVGGWDNDDDEDDDTGDEENDAPHGTPFSLDLPTLQEEAGFDEVGADGVPAGSMPPYS